MSFKITFITGNEIHAKSFSDDIRDMINVCYRCGTSYKIGTTQEMSGAVDCVEVISENGNHQTTKLNKNLAKWKTNSSGLKTNYWDYMIDNKGNQVLDEDGNPKKELRSISKKMPQCPECGCSILHHPADK